MEGVRPLEAGSGGTRDKHPGSCPRRGCLLLASLPLTGSGVGRLQAKTARPELSIKFYWDAVTPGLSLTAEAALKTFSRRPFPGSWPTPHGTSPRFYAPGPQVEVWNSHSPKAKALHGCSWEHTFKRANPSPLFIILS